MRLSTLLLSGGLLISSITAGAAQMTQDEIRQGFLNHAAMAQYYRWYQVYERPDGGIANALDILSEDTVISSGLGTANGHAEYEARVSQLPSTWRNAHHVRDVAISHGDDGTMALNATITYQNQGMLEDDAVRQADLTYHVTLVPGETVLPLLSEVTIEQNSQSTADTFDDAYAENRLRSLVHYWLALIEDPARNAEPVREILAEDFTLNFSSGAITDFAGFEAWLTGPASQITASTHIISNFSTEETGPDTYRLNVDFDWVGILPDGSELMAKTRHRWAVVNDVTERFARIQTVDVEIVQAFQPRSSGTAN